jgi:hypothetical protein
LHEQIEQGFPPLCAMPALPSTVLMYLGWLSTEDKVHAGSLQPYLSEINQCHINFGFAAPALGHDVCLFRKAFGYVEGQHTVALKTSESQRGTMPSSVMLQILHLGLRTPCTHTLRCCACLVTQFAWFCRSDMSMLRRAHITFQARGISLNERTKTLPRCNAAPVFRTGDTISDAGSLVLRLLLRWELQHPHDSHDLFWSTSEDSYSPSAWGTSIVNTWPQDARNSLAASSFTTSLRDLDQSQPALRRGLCVLRYQCAASGLSLLLPTDAGSLLRLS